MIPINLPLAELKPALVGLAKGIQKHSLPILAAVKIERTRDGWVTLTTTDLDHFITVRLEQPVDGDPTTIVIPHDELLKLANKCGKDDTLSVCDAGIIKYPVGKQLAENRCTSLPAEEFPEIPRIKGDPIPVNDGLRQVIHEAMECASSDPTRYILNGVYIDVSDRKCQQVVATDGSHLFASNSFSLPLTESIIIPDHKFLGWKGFNTDGEWQMRLATDPKEGQKPFLQVSSRRWRFITNQHEGNYPNWRQVLPTEFKTTVDMTDDVLANAIAIVERIPYDAESRHKPVTLVHDGKKLSIRGRARDDSEWTSVEIPGAKITGNMINIHLNRDFLLKALGFGLNRIEMIDHLSPLKFSNGGRQMVVMPVRPAEEPAPAEEVKPVAADTKVEAPTNERSNMINDTTPEPAETRSPLEMAMDQLETLKDTLKNNIASVSLVLASVKTAIREQKVTARQQSDLRATLRTLQTVRI